MTRSVTASAAAPLARHRFYEDALALAIGTLFLALGVVMFGHAGLLTGGTAGLAFLIRYATGTEFSVAFFLLNLPFYLFAWWRMGLQFTVKTFCAVALLSLFAHYLPYGLVFAQLWSPLAAVLGGLLCGCGMLILFRHRASLGGIGVVVLYLQDRFGWRAGHLQMGIDGLILLGAFWTTDWQRALLSVLGALAMNMTLAVNHRPGRYLAV